MNPLFLLALLGVGGLAMWKRNRPSTIPFPAPGSSAFVVQGNAYGSGGQEILEYSASPGGTPIGSLMIGDKVLIQTTQQGSATEPDWALLVGKGWAPLEKLGGTPTNPNPGGIGPRGPAV